ncbi:MAG: hypothetical protein ACRDRO_08375 [Pseudonocardiaceae bacterium]
MPTIGRRAVSSSDTAPPVPTTEVPAVRIASNAHSARVYALDAEGFEALS